MESTTRKQSQINLAVVGVGHWGKNLVRNFHDLGALTALCDADESIETNYKRQYPGVKFYRKLGELLSDPSITAVALATPAVTHYEMAKEVLLADKERLRRKAAFH